MDLLRKQLGELQAEVLQLRRRVAVIEGGGAAVPDLTIRLYCRQKASTSAPSEGSKVGKFGGAGIHSQTLSLAAGVYRVIDTYEIETEDFGNIRWVQVSCDMEAPTRTNDGFAYLVVKPSLVDAQNLYEQLIEQRDGIMLDELTKEAWGRNGINSFYERLNSKWNSLTETMPPNGGLNPHIGGRSDY